MMIRRVRMGCGEDMAGISFVGVQTLDWIRSLSKLGIVFGRLLGLFSQKHQLCVIAT